MLQTTLKISGAILVSGLMAYLQPQFPLKSLNVHAGDLFSLVLPKESPSGKVVTVRLTGEEKEEYFKPSFELSRYKKLLQEITKQDPLLVISTIDPVGAEGDTSEQRKFLRYVKNRSNIYFYTPYTPDSLPPADWKQHYTFHPVYKGSQDIYISLTEDSGLPPYDGRFRRIILYFSEDNKVNYLMNLLSQFGIPTQVDQFSRGSFPLLGSRQVYIQPRSKDAYEPLSLAQYQKQEGGQIVVLGHPPGMNDDHTSRSIHTKFQDTKPDLLDSEQVALVLDTMIRKDYIRIASPTIQAIVSFAIFMFYFMGLMVLTPRRSFAWGFAALFLWIVANAAAYYWFSTYLFTVFTPLALIAIHYFVSTSIFFRHIQRQKQKARNLEVESIQAQVVAKSARADLGLKLATQVAHDLRSPLMALSVVTQKSVDLLPKDVESLLEQSVQRLSGISSNLLRKYRQGGMHTKASSPSFSLSKSINDIVESFQQSWSRVQFKKNIAPDITIKSAHQTDFERALSNLLMNATEAVIDHGKDPEISIFLEHRSNEEILIKISDNGPGVPENLRAKIFERGETFGKKGGSGLGLAQAKEAFQKMGGDIELETNKFGGACFKVTLPVQHVQPTLTIHSRALVFEDDPRVRSQWIEKLEAAGVRVMAFGGWSEFTQQPVEIQSPFSVISDLVFDDEDETGFDILKWFIQKADHRILCTSLGKNAEVQAAANKYAHLVLDKTDFEKAQIVVTKSQVSEGA